MSTPSENILFEMFSLPFDHAGKRYTIRNHLPSSEEKFEFLAVLVPELRRACTYLLNDSGFNHDPIGMTCHLPPSQSSWDLTSMRSRTCECFVSLSIGTNVNISDLRPTPPEEATGSFANFLFFLVF